MTARVVSVIGTRPQLVKAAVVDARAARRRTFRGDHGRHRAALRPGDVVAPAGGPHRCARVAQPRPARRVGARPARSHDLGDRWRARGRATGRGARVRRHQLDAGGRARRVRARPADRARRGRVALVQPGDARGAQPGARRPCLGPAALPDPGRRAQPRRRRRDRGCAPRRRRDVRRGDRRARAVETAPSDLLEGLGVEPGAYVVATVHRAETTDDPAALAAVLDELLRVAAEQPVVFPVHPRTRQAMRRGRACPTPG